ncbi:MAG: hypothetical protein PHO91_03065 [Patescibacteria group bacterium]|nr:hypothetical protein [Patescibacteria group bacterium]
MTNKQFQLMWRWSLTSALLIALLWAIYYLIVGAMPEVPRSGRTVYLPFTLSRWWDILIGPIYSIIVITFFSSNSVRRDKNLIGSILVFFGLIAGLLIFGLAIDLSLVLTIGLTIGLIAGLIFGLIFGLGFSSAFSLIFSLAFSLGFSLFVSLGFGLTAGLIAGLIANLGFGLGFGLAFNLVYGLKSVLKFIFSKKTWTRYWNWLMVRD